MFLIQNKATQLSQPQVAAEIDWSNPITRGLVSGFNALNIPQPIGKYKNGLSYSNLTKSVTKYGNVFPFNNSSSQITLPKVDLSSYRGFTIVSVMSASTQATDMIFEQSVDGGSNDGFYIYGVNSTQLRFVIKVAGQSYVLSDVTYTIPTEPTIVAMSIDTSANTFAINIYNNGIIAASGTIGGVAGVLGNDVIYVGSRAGNSLFSASSYGTTLIFGGAKSDAEIKSLSANPWQIFKPIPRRIFVPVSAGGATTYTLTAQPGTYSLTGQSATLLKHRSLTAQTGTYNYSGNNATITYNASAAVYTLTAQTGTYSYSGTSASISRHRNLTASSGTYNISGTSATILRHKKLIASTGSYSITGSDATISRNRRLTATTGTYTINGQQVTITRTTLTPVYTITALPGSYSLSGSVATILKHRSLTAQTGAYTYTGNTITLEKYTPSSGGGLVKYLDVLAGELLILKPLGDTGGGGGGTIEPEYAVRLSDASSTITYIGEAAITSLESDPVWRIKKLESLLSGTEVSLKWAGGTQLFDKVWDDRASLTYI